MNFFQSFNAAFQQLEKDGIRRRPVPQTINDRWRDNYDIESLDKMIRQFLNEKLKKVPELEATRKKLYDDYENSKTRVERYTIRSKIEEIENEISRIVDASKRYDAEMKIYIEAYKQLKNTPDLKRTLLVDLFLK